MITEDYCSYEVSKLLKEKGFSEKCVACYDWIDNSLRTIYHDTTGEVEPQDWNNLTFEEAGKIGLANWYRNISAPTHQMAMKWLRDVYDIHISVNKTFLINDMDNKPYLVYVCTKECHTSYNAWSEYHSTYEQAVEAALKYCLTELI